MLTSTGQAHVVLRTNSITDSIRFIKKRKKKIDAYTDGEIDVRDLLALRTRENRESIDKLLEKIGYVLDKL